MRYAITAEIRSRSIRYLTTRGETLYQQSYHPGYKERRARLGNVLLRLVWNQHLIITVDASPRDLVVYDSDRLEEYQNQHVIEHVVLPLLRREMLLDDLARV